MIYYKILIFFVAGFHVIFCRPELKFDETGNVLDNASNEFNTEEKPMDFLKLVASKVKEAKAEDIKIVDENKNPIEKEDPKSKEEEVKDSKLENENPDQEKVRHENEKSKNNSIEFDSVPNEDITDENDKSDEKNKNEKNDENNKSNDGKPGPTINIHMHDDIPPKVNINASDKAILENNSNEKGLPDEVSKDAKADVAALKEMHRKLSTITDPKEKAKMRTEIMLKVHSLEQLLNKTGHVQTEDLGRSSNIEHEERSSGILTKSEFDYDQNGIIISSSKSSTTELPMMETFEPLVSFENTTKSSESATVSEENSTDENDDTSGSGKNKTKAGKNQSTTRSSTTAETTLPANEITTITPNETEILPTIQDDDSDLGVTDPIPTKESSEKVTKSVKDEITEDKSGDVGFFYPWESPVCENVHGDEHCSKFKENFRCHLDPGLAYRVCRKKCKLCMKDNPKPMKLVANLTMFKSFSSSMPKITLTQSNPVAPTFMTICANPISEKEELYSALIHSFGDISEDGKECQSFGPHYNPFGASHGHPSDPSKHSGDLGNLKFGDTPKDWPENMPTCDSLDLGAFGMFDHVNLYGSDSPIGRPVAIYEGEAPLHGFSNTNARACGKLLPE